MKKSKDIIVICAIDAQVEAVKKLIPQIPCDVGLATYGNTHCKPTKVLNTLGNHYDAPRQDFIPEGSDYHCCEFLAYLDIAEHFYKEYENVYLCHHDIEITKNPLPTYEKEMTGKWSFIAPLAQANDGTDRLSHELFIISEDFIRYMKGKYITHYEAWKKEFKNYSMHSDLCMLDLMDYDGFKGKTIDSVVHHIEKPAAPVINGILQV